jgi:drug/metabolite transporter (DMT)-like permease
LGQAETLRNVSRFSLAWAGIFSCFLLFTQLMQILAMSRGFVSLSTLIYSCGFLVPIFYCALFLNEPISPWQILGIVILLCALVIVLPPEKNGKFSFLWLTFILLATLGSGTNAIIQKIHQASDFRGELVPFLILSLGFASILSFAASLLSPGESRRQELYRGRGSVTLMLLGGIVVGGMNVANLTLAGKLPAVIQFPVYNVCSMLLTALAGRVLFGERIGRRKLVGFLVGLGAITIIGLL